MEVIREGEGQLISWHDPDETMSFDEESKQMKLLSVYSRISVEDVVASTDFDLLIPDKVSTTPPPK